MQPVIININISISWESFSKINYAKFIKSRDFCFFFTVSLASTSPSLRFIIAREFREAFLSKIRVCFNIKLTVLRIISTFEIINTFLWDNFIKLMAKFNHKFMNITQS